MFPIIVHGCGASWKYFFNVLGRELFKSLGEMENNLLYLKLGSSKNFGLVEIIYYTSILVVLMFY
jgi:hypothetical protein